MTQEPSVPDDLPDPAADAAGETSDAVAPGKRRKESMGQSIGGVLFGFEQQVLRTMPPPQELVRHARPDAPIPAGDGSLIHIGMPDLVLPDDPGEAEPGPRAESGEDRRTEF